jgi:hypothetical protein
MRVGAASAYLRGPLVRKSFAVFLLGAVAAIAGARLATPGTITFDVPTINVAQEPYDQTGYFDVTVFQTGGGSTLYAFQTDLLLNSGASNVSFIDADLNTSVPYVFSANSFQETFGGLPAFAPNEASFADDPFNNVGIALSSTPLGLMRVEYDVPADTAVGSYALTFNQDPVPNGLDGHQGDIFADFVDTTSIFDNNDIFSPAVINGAINVVPTPEPSSVVLMVLGAVGWVGLGWRRGRRAR